MKNKKIYIIGFSIIGAGAYFIYKYMQKRKEGQTLSYADSVKQDTKAITSAITSAVLPVASFPLKNGSVGSNVQTLQKYLNDKGYASPKLVTDGKFGAKTESAVKTMQDNPYEKSISDYFANFNVSWKPKEVSKDFYDVFVTKTKLAPKGGANTGLFN
jgi:hypothetical protein